MTKKELIRVLFPASLIALVLISVWVFRRAQSQNDIPYLTRPICGDLLSDVQVSSTYNEQVTAVLRQLMLLSPALSPAMLQERFTEHTQSSLHLYDGDAAVSLAVIPIHRCARGSRNNTLVSAFYVLDWLGTRRVFEIDRNAGYYLNVRWEQDHWVIITNTDYSGYVYTPYQLRVVAEENAEWAQIQVTELGTGSMTQEQFDLTVTDDGQMIRFTQTDVPDYLPCHNNVNYDDYYLLTTLVTDFRYDGRTYQVAEQQFLPSILPRFPDEDHPAEGTLVEDWMSLCIPGSAYDATQVPAMDASPGNSPPA